MTLNKTIFALLVCNALFLAGCVAQNSNAGNSTLQQNTSVQEQAKLVGEIEPLALTVNDTGFELTDSSELSPDENGEQLVQAGFDKGFSNGFALYDENSFQRVVHQVSRYNTTQGALSAYEQTRKVIMESNEIVSDLNVGELGDAQFGVKGSRTVDLGTKTAAIDDYIIVFVKANILEAVDYFGLKESVSEQKALQLAQAAAAKFVS